MSVEVRVPALPESVADAQLVSWRKQVGDAVRRDENLVEIETDKVILEVPAPVDGILARIDKAADSTVTADELLAIIDTTAAAEPQPAATPAAEPQPVAAAPVANAQPLSPAVRRLVEETGLDASRIPATGRDGRLPKGDVLAFMQQPQDPAATPPAPAAATQPQSAPPPAPATALPGVDVNRPVRREKMTRLRARIAERLTQAQATAAILTTFNEVDLSAVMAIRKRLKDDFEKTHDARLGFMSFFVKAACEALRQYPVVNAAVENDDIVYHDYYDISIAVSSPRGLVVPVIRDADQMTFAQVESTIAEFGNKAKDGAIGIADLTGGTFSITNGGVFGSLVSTPILNPPQSAILGMHKIQERPVAVDGQVVIRPMMYLALSYDHRIIDGREAVSFLTTLKSALEDPAKLLLNL